MSREVAKKESNTSLAAFRETVPETREISVLHETGLVTARQAECLAVATRDSHAMNSVSSLPKGRHLQYIDTILSSRSASPVSRARDSLIELGSIWRNARSDFHRLRKLYFEVKLKRAEVKKLGRALERCLEEGEQEDADILEAKIELETASIEGLESDLSYGMRDLEGVSRSASDASERYAEILELAGKEALTEQDFLDEEIDFYLKSAFFHAAQTMRSQSYVPGGNDRGPRVNRIDLQEEIILYLENLDISRKEVEKELTDLLDMRHNFDFAHGGEGRHEQSFRDHFTNWVNRMATKYRDRVEQAVAQYGVGRIQRIVSIIEPTRSDGASDHEDDLAMRTEKRESMIR